MEGLKRFEGCRLKAYLCPAGVWTIGYGHTGTDVYEGMKITLEGAEALLDKDLDYFEKFVEDVMTERMTDNQFSAMVSLAFNIGTGNPMATKRKRGFYWSSLRRLFNEGDTAGAGEVFLKYCKARDPKSGGYVILRGLQKRRQFEKDLFDDVEITIDMADIPEFTPTETVQFTGTWMDFWVSTKKTQPKVRI